MPASDPEAPPGGKLQQHAMDPPGGGSQELAVGPPGDRTRYAQAHTSVTLSDADGALRQDSEETLGDASRLLCQVGLSICMLLAGAAWRVLQATTGRAYTVMQATMSRVGSMLQAVTGRFLSAGSRDRVLRAGSNGRFLFVLLALLAERVCPGTLSRRRQVLVYAIGFVAGSFIYVSLLNVSYALHYAGHKMQLDSGSTVPTARTTLPWNVGSLPTTRVNVAGFSRSTRHHLSLPRDSIRQTAQHEPRLQDARGRVAQGIPHIIHQSWHVKLVPKQFSPWMMSWRKNHPTWRNLFWTGNGGTHLVSKQFPEFRSLYENYTTELHRFKVNRFFLLYRYGGVFADLDLESLKPLDGLLQRYSCILTEQPIMHRAILFNLTAPNYVLNSFMACAPGHPFLKFVLEMLVTYQVYDSVIEPDIERIEKSVGSLFLGDVLELYKIAFNRTVEEYVHVLPSEWLMPNWNEQYRAALASQCISTVASLNAVGKSMCAHLMTTDFGNAVPREAFIACHWVNLYEEDTRLRLAEQPVVAVDKLQPT